jgi:predicted transcriptional regulator of viral defense system
MLREYQESDKKDFARLVAVARKSASGAAWKRLGYLAEILFHDELPSAARRHLSAGNARLDPAVRKRGRLVKRWRLWVNVDLGELAESLSAP